MLYLFYGPDTYRSRQKLNETLSVFRSKRSNLALFNFDEQNFSEESFKELLASQTLFDEKHAVVCENILENKNVAGFILENIETVVASPNVFILLEGEVDSDVLEKITIKAQKSQRLEMLSGVALKKWVNDELGKKEIKNSLIASEAVIKKCGSDLWCASKEIEKISLGGMPEKEASGVAYNPFAIADAVGGKDKGKAWLVLQQARLAGVSEEEVFWKMWWQIKTLLLVKKSVEAGARDLAKETGLKDYPLSKALANIKKFAPGELEEMSYKYIEFYHKARIGLEDWEVGVERLLIS